MDLARLRGIAGALFAVAACAGPAAELRVGTVEIIGNEQISSRDIRAGLATRGPRGILRRYDEYDPLTVDADVERIRSFYRRRGYFHAEVIEVEVGREDERGVVVRFRVDEGPPTRISRVVLAGLPDGAAAPLRAGRVLDHGEYLAVKERLRRELVTRGHVHAAVTGTVRVDRARNTAEVELSAEAGPEVRFGSTRIEGLDRLPPSVVFARLAWDPGEVVTPDKLEATQGRLYRLGWFRTVSVELEAPERAKVADVVVRVEEALRHEVRLGGGLAADQARWELRGRAGYTLFGFLDPRTQLVTDLMPAYAMVRGEGERRGFGGEARVSLLRHDLFVPRLEGHARLAYRQIELEAYRERGPLARLLAGRPLLRDSVHIAAGWEGRIASFFDPHPALAEELAGRQRLLFLDQSISLDRRDDLLDPRAGTYLELRLEEGRYVNDGARSYVKGLAEGRGYVSIAPRLIGAARVRYGRAVAGDLPITQRFYSGGGASHRGFPMRRLSPFVVAPEVPVGGDSLFEGSVELRARLFRLRGRMVTVVVFADGGDVTAAGDEVNLADLHWAVGGGLRYDTIVGPVRFDVGTRVNRFGPGEPQAGDRVSFHLSVGEAF